MPEGSITWQVIVSGSVAGQIERRERTGTLFGDLLRHWRKVRGVSQLDLALAADTSQRHVSFLESGRSRPSRAMVLALAERLDIPLRARNEILTAAGHAPHFPERSLTSEALVLIGAILKRILEHHEPYPAFVLDGGWNLLMINTAGGRLIAPFGAAASAGPGRIGTNFIKLMCDPNGLRPFITSWSRTGPALLGRLRREAAANPGGPVEQLLRELLVKNVFPPIADIDNGQSDATIPVELQLGERRVRLVTTITTFGTPQDVALQELRIEMSFPADEESDQFLRGSSETTESSRGPRCSLDG